MELTHGYKIEYIYIVVELELFAAVRRTNEKHTAAMHYAPAPVYYVQRQSNGFECN